MGFKLDLRHCSLAPFFFVYAFMLIFFPRTPIFFSSPLLAAALYKLNSIRFLWFGLWAGLFLDLLSTDSPIGFQGATFLLTCVGIGFLKRHFFSDSLSTLPIMTFFASLLQSMITVVLSPLFDLPFSLSLPWVFTDLIVMPLLDASFAFLVYILVPMLFKSRSRRREDYFMQE